MKPADGKYRLTSTNPPGFVATVTVTGTTLTTFLGFGPLTYDEAHDWFASPDPDVTIRCTGEGSFEAVQNFGTPQQQAYEGSCALIP
ncbi:MAG: hypothetical protein GY720_15990 [bacterium]|nr:hypothetical protein [bacterium]MCP5065268.1 hypothetical protein [bacterium]